MHFVHYGLRPLSMRCAYRNLDNCSCVILPSNIHVGRMRFSGGIPAARPYFSSTAKKSRQKKPLSDQLSNPL
jgi:hypothetical protein